MQVGDYLGEDDIERFADNYGRADTPKQRALRREGGQDALPPNANKESLK